LYVPRFLKANFLSGYYLMLIFIYQSLLYLHFPPGYVQCLG
jgi:hypothetical protein